MTAKLCPFPHEDGRRGPCLEHRCHFYIQLLGKHPQKDAPVPEWGCTFAWLPILLIENAKETRQFAAAVESSRNEAAKGSAAVAASVVQVADELREMARAAVARTVPTQLSEARPSGLRRLLGFLGGKA